jgi:predicted nucleotidyltransferase
MLSRVQQMFADLPIQGVDAVYLFGSHAAGRAHAESDIDIAVLLNRSVYRTAEERFTVRLAIIAHLGERLGASVDIVILNDAPPLLGRAIVTDGRAAVVYDAERDHAYRRDIQLRAADLEPFIQRHRRGLLAELAR